MSNLKKLKPYINLRKIVEDLAPDLSYVSVNQHINGKNTKGEENDSELSDKEKKSLKPAFEKVSEMLKGEADKM